MPLVLPRFSVPLPAFQGPSDRTSLRRWRLEIAIPAVGVASLATHALRSITPQRPLSLVFFFAAVTFSAGFGGLRSGVLATLVSALVCDYFFLPPYHSLAVASSDVPLLVLFLLVALLINGLSERLQAGMRAADQRFQGLLQGLDAIVWEADPQTLAFTFVSRRAEEILGYPVHRWLSEPEFRTVLLHPEDRERVLATCRSALAQEGDHAMEYRAVAADGREVWLHETLRLLAGGRGQTVRLSGLCVDITARKRADEALAVLYEQVRSGREHLQRVSRQLVQVQEAERRGIARELHDEIGQVLTGLKLMLEMGQRMPVEKSEESLRHALVLVNELMERVDDLSLDLRPAMLDDLGLMPTLLWHFERYTALTGVKIRFEQAGLERRMPMELETAAYRIVQEALTNVARHADVKEATVRLWSTRDLLGVQIIDAGQGFDPGRAARDGIGLAGMEERAVLLGGSLTVESGPGAGTCLTAELPFDGRAE